MTARRALAHRVAAGLAAALLALGCSRSSEPNAPAAAETPPVSAAPSPGEAAERVPTARVRRGELRAQITASGSVVARRTAALAASVPGRLARVHVDLGDPVREGDALFEIDAEPYRLSVEESRANLALARAEAAQAADEAERARTLADKEMIPRQQYERVRTQAASARARVEAAAARLERAEHDLSRCVVRAPFAGSIVDRHADEGAMAAPGPQGVVVLQETSALEAVVDIPEASPARVRPGDPARLFVEGGAEPLAATVGAVSDRIDAASRTYRVRIPLADPSRTLKSGAFVRAEIEPAPRSGALLIERSAIVSQDGRAYVLRVSGGVAERVLVRVGASGGAQAELLEGVAEGDEIVIGDAAARIASGVRVETLPAADSRSAAARGLAQASAPNAQGRP
jgi:RND family efflux transporter MFP subunit